MPARRRRRNRALFAAGLAAALGVLVACGVVAVLIAAGKDAQASELQIATFSENRALHVAQDVATALSSVALTRPFISRNPGPLTPGVASPTFTLALQDDMSVVPERIITQVYVSYQGRGITAADPPLPPSAGSLVQADAAFGPASGALYNETMFMLRTGLPVLTASQVTNQSATLFWIRMPAFANASSANETWGWPASMSAQACLDGSAPCFNATAGTKWWGFITLAMSRDLLAGTLGMRRLSTSGYGYTVTLRQNNTGPQREPTLLGTNNPNCRSHTVSSTQPVLGAFGLTVELCMLEHNEPSWRTPLLVVVVVVPVLLVAAMGFAIATWLRHSELLHAIMPASSVEVAVRSVLTKSNAVHLVSADSPADKLVSVLVACLHQEQPDTRDVVQLLMALRQRADIYMPYNLEKQLLQMAGDNSEVAAALMAQVGPDAGAAPRTLLPLSSGRGSGDGGAQLQRARSGAPDTLENDALDLLSTKDPEDVRNVLLYITGVGACKADPLHGTSCSVDEAAQAGAPQFAFLTSTPRTDSGFLRSKRAMAFGVEPGDEDSIIQSSMHDFMLGPDCAAPPAASVVTELEHVLNSSYKLDGSFDAMALAQASSGHPLAAMGYWAIVQSGLMRKLQLPQAKVMKYLWAVEAGYSKENPYHSATHAADVLQRVHALLHTGGLRSKHANTPTLVLSCYLAALVHDYEHKGVTNDFLVATHDDFALVYNDRSPHENHHASAAFRLLKQDKLNFLADLPKAEATAIRKTVIDLVLATDMKQHFALNGAFASMHRLATAQGVDRAVKRPRQALATHTRLLPLIGALRPQRPPTAGRTSSPNIDSNPTVHGTQYTGSHTLPSTAGAAPNSASIPLPGAVVVAIMPSQAPPPSTRLHHVSSSSLGTVPLQSSHAATCPSNVQPHPTLSSDMQAATAAGSEGNNSRPDLVSPVAQVAQPKVVGDCCTRPIDPGPGPVDDADRLLSLQMMLKCSDLGHVAAALPVHLKWVSALEEEMFKQGDREAALGLPVSPLCKRGQAGVTQSQVGFFTAVCLPLFANFSLHFPGATPMLDAVAENYRHWKRAAGGELD